MLCVGGTILGFSGGAASGYRYAKDNGINWQIGEYKISLNNLNSQYDFTTDPHGDNVRLY